MSKRIVIDPVTRIEGHLKIECEVDNGKVVNAGHPDRCGAALKSSSKAATPERPGFSHNGFAASERPFMLLPRSGRSRTL